MLRRPRYTVGTTWSHATLFWTQARTRESSSKLHKCGGFSSCALRYLASISLNAFSSDSLSLTVPVSWSKMDDKTSPTINTLSNISNDYIDLESNRTHIDASDHLLPGDIRFNQLLTTYYGRIHLVMIFVFCYVMVISLVAYSDPYPEHAGYFNRWLNQTPLYAIWYNLLVFSTITDVYFLHSNAENADPIRLVTIILVFIGISI